MKRRLTAAALALALLGLTGCGWLENEYVSVSEHKEPYVYTEPETERPIPTASDADALQALILSFVREGTARDMIDVTNYSGDVRTDVAEVMNALAYDPIYAYAVDYSDYEFYEQDEQTLLEVDMVYRRSAEEIAAIRSVRGMESAKVVIADALNNLDMAVTMKITEYSDMDYESYVTRACLENPAQIVEIPEITVAVYPQKGTTRVVELYFGYSNSRDEMRSMQKNISTLLSSVGSYVRRGDTQADRLKLLCEYLITRNDYQETTGPDMPAYSLLSRLQADDAGFASAFYYGAKQAGMECWLVCGSKDGAPYYWNIVELDDRYYHIDLMQQWRSGIAEPELHTDAEMAGYEWDREQYPQCTGEEPEE